MKTPQIKGIKKATSEAKRIPAGFHMEGYYSQKTGTLTLFDELLTFNEWKVFDLEPDEIQVSIYPGDTMEEIKARIYYDILEDSVL